MTVQYVTNSRLYIGESGDTKPTGVPVGSIFLESDTDAIYRTTDAGTTWVQIDTLVKLVAGTAVVGKVRLVTAAGDELSEDTNDSVKAGIYQGGNQVEVQPAGLADGSTGNKNLLMVGNRPQLINGAGTFDNIRNNATVTVLTSAARTAETDSSDIVNYNASALILFINVSAITDTPALTPKLQIKDAISSNYFTVWTAATPITATGQYAYLFALGGAGGAGSYTEAVNIRLGRTWRFRMSVADADSATYSVGGTQLV